MAEDSGKQFPRRLNLRLTEETLAPYEELAAFDGRGVSAIVRQVLENAAPEVSRLVDVLRAAYGSVPTDGTDLYRKYMRSLQERAGVEVARAELWHKEVEGVAESREVSAV
jgi:hypothetical protein